MRGDHFKWEILDCLDCNANYNSILGKTLTKPTIILIIVQLKPVMDKYIEDYSSTKTSKTEKSTQEPITMGIYNNSQALVFCVHK